jgi:hypothetical protein
MLQEEDAIVARAKVFNGLRDGIYNPAEGLPQHLQLCNFIILEQFYLKNFLH